MNFKRQLSGEDGKEFEFPVPEPKRRLTFTNVVRDAMPDARLNGVLERSLQRIVRDELERRIPSFMASPRPSNESGSASGGSGLQLRFINKLPTTIFTGSRVEAENGEPLQIELVDASTGAIVHSGPLSSLKVELFVLNGEFGSDDQEDWTEKELNTNIVREREGKRPLVTGDIHVTLREGVGSLGDVMFTDNSSWIRCRKFRLAARVVAKVPSEVRIREATSEPFVVKDHRGVLYKKHHPPHPNDEIWRLEKISKDGAFHNRLYEKGISTVEDFLQSYMKDASSLRNVLRGISNRIWDTIVEHAMACKLDDHKFYAYHGAEQDVISLMFNSIHGLVGAIINGQFCSLDGLDSHQKMLVEALKQQAYRNVRDLVPVDASTIFGLSKPLPVPQADSFTCPNPDMQQVEFQLTHQVYKKHHPPHPNDEIWRLEKISKDGAFHNRLYEKGISTVEDFLQSYMKDASSLRNFLHGISNKIWDTIVEHAMACKLDDHKFYAYHRAEQDVISLIFNSIHGLVGAIINGQFCSLDGLDSHQKMRVEALKQQAYRNVRDLVPIDASTIFGLSKLLPVPQADSFACPNPDMQQVEFQLTHQVYKKHHPPHPNDKIWRLEKISKDGAFHKRLYEKGISTVEDFLQSYMKDASSLRNVLRGISNKIWDTIVEHAMACKLDDRKFYAYHRAEQDVSLMFNSIHGLEGAIINGQFCSLDELDANQKMLVEALKQQAYRNVRDLVPVDASTMFGLSKPLPVLQADSFTCPNPDLRQSEFQLTHQDGLPIQLGFNHASTSTSCPYQAEGSSNQLMVSVAQPSDPIQLRSSSFSMEDLSSIIDNGESSWPPVDGFQAPIVPTGHLSTECKT